MKRLYKSLLQIILLLLTTAFPSFLFAQELTLEAAPASRNSVSLNWNLPGQGETAFVLQRKLGASGSYSSIATLSAQDSAYLDANLNGDTTYYYQLTASGTGATSNVVSVVLENGLDSIPAAIKIKKDGTLPSETVRTVRLDTFLLGEQEEVFKAPPCLEGEYYVAFQLYHDLGNQLTTEDWTSFLEVTLLHVDDTLWTKNLQNDMASQTFRSTVFHPEPLACGEGYYLRLDKKTLTGNVPESNIFVRMMLFPVDTLGFDPAEQPELSVSYVSDSCNVSWDYDGTDAEEFDLEWVFIADYENYTISSATEAFSAKEGVRISTPKHSYEHTMFYPDGRLYFRTRAVGRDPLYPEHRITGAWGYADGAFTFSNLEEGKNWQSQTILAEDGKYKKLLSYMDGSLRNRQSLTNLSTDTLVMVAESRYDFEGRKAIDVLPAPLKSKQLNYRNSFNQFTGSDPKVNANTAADKFKFHYDNHSARNSTLANNSGAGKYYSPNNDIKTNKSYHPYIPDAEGYAYSQVEYTQDNSGRISKQSGVGEAFRMDSTHTTRYFYGTPSAAELVRLFGSNVGKASHYRKNMTVDPNGQVSVSYEDQEGRAIATALAGEKPEAMAALPSYDSLPTDAITVDISDKNQVIENQRVIAHTILNTSPQTAYAFEYSLSALGSMLENGSCQSCAYDLRITLTDPDGELVNLASAAGNISASGLSYERHGITAADCSNPTTVNDINFTDTLQKVGEYTISKELVAQELSYEELTTMVLADTTVQARISALEQTYSLDSADCEVCTTCEDTESIINETIDEVAAQSCENIYQQIVSYYQQNYAMDTVPQDSIEAHADYCKYQLCQKNQASKSFESQMARVADWTAALALGYNQLQDLDPFFNQEGLSGYGYKSGLTTRLNDIEIGTVQYDTNGDSIPDGSTTYAGTLWEITDPYNTAYYLNEDGNPDTTGRHILYWDIMGKEGQMDSVAYAQELDESRWQLFKSYYLEAKRDVKLNGGITEIDNCPSYKEELGTIDEMPTTEEGIRLWAEENGLYQPVSDTELEYTLANIVNACDTELSTADSSSVMDALRAYFDSDEDNFFRLILLEDLGTNGDANLETINNILSSYSCSLDGVAVANPMICLRDTVIIVVNNMESQSNAVSSSIDEAKLIHSYEESSEEDKLGSRDLVKEKKRKVIEDFLREEDNNMIEIKANHKKELSRNTLMLANTSMTATAPSQAEYDALFALYNSTNGPNWTNNTGWSSADPNVIEDVSNWYGISTDTSGHVTYINLENNNLTGFLPEEIGSLSYLSSLYLRSNNNLQGEIPESIGNLNNLRTFWISNSGLGGVIPDSFGNLSNLTSVHIVGNDFVGDFPDTLRNLSNLRILWIIGTDLNGEIPNIFGNMTSLQDLRINDNENITGPFPESIVEIPFLRTLYLSGNNLQGNIPSDIDNLNYLRVLLLHENQLDGEIPDGIGNLTGLTSLRLDVNKLEGMIPNSIMNLVNLNYLGLEHNYLEGDIPILPSTISGISLGYNNFTFSDLLPVLQNFQGNNLTYSNQGNIDSLKARIGLEGMSFTLTSNVDRFTTPSSKYQWFKYVENGGDIPLQASPTANGHTYTFQSFSESDAGKYYYQITNDDASDLTLTSHFVTVKLGREVSICLEYAPPSLTDNPTLAAYTFDVDWNEATARCLSFNQRRDSVLVQAATEKLIDEEAINFYQSYQTNCIGQANDKLEYSYVPKEYHYTLYYYDQAGNLVQTVPPKGVKPLSSTQVDNFLAGNTTEPNHELVTKYRYNSLNQLRWQQTPDADESEFWYEGKGQLRLSQNAKQAAHSNYSYTKYDAQGRVIEVGQLASNNVILDSLLSQAEDPDFPAPDSNFTLSDITRTYYDSADSQMQGLFAQQNLRSRVSWVEVIDSLSTDMVTTHYSYDIHGNVKSLMQQIPGLGNKQTDYVYDLVSGNVNYVFYQFEQEDQFLQKYQYDADNRLTEVKSSSDGFIWNTEAVYFYYPHGPLARVELGERSSQGLDYYYTLQGWLKGVNGSTKTNDPAQDGINGSRVGKDAIAFALGYHEDDFNGIGATQEDNQLWTRLNEQYPGTGQAVNKGLHNGNIAWMQTHLAGLEDNPQQAMLYQYDQLNRLVQAQSLGNFNETTGFAARSSSPEAYDAQYSYDANGNLLSLQRHNAQASLMDDYTYSYITGTNRLANLEDAMPPDTTYFDTKTYDSGVLKPDDKVYREITVEGSTTAEQGTNPQLKANEVITLKQNFHAKAGSGFHAKWVSEPNYEIQDDNADFTYDEIGNLIADSSAGTTISWTPYGKVRQVIHQDSTKVTYRYDGAGNRVEKKIVSSDSSTTVTRYIRDASGNVLAIYKDSTLTEQPIYGSSRLGMYRGGTATGHENLGNRQYELSNHLGNVLAVITDNINMDADSTWATVASLHDYYPFGMEMEGRSYIADGDDEDYRFGFQGQEKNEELKTIHFKFREHDPRIGRFWSVDPLAHEFPWNSPYAFSENRVIASIELEGLEAVDLNTNNNVNEPYSSQQNMAAIGTNDVTPWNDLINFKPSSTDVNNAGNRVFGTPKVQNIEDGNGQLNVDYYSVTISNLPNGVSSGEDLLNYFRNNLNSFTNSNTSFGHYNKGEGKRFLANENSALMSFEVIFMGGFINPDDLSVMQSKNSTNYWVFSTMTTFRDGGHPVSGNRQFGVTTNNNGTFTFFTRGADRPNTMLDKVTSGQIFKGADALWQAVMTNMVNHINDNGGNAEKNVTYSKQIDWKE